MKITQKKKTSFLGLIDDVFFCLKARLLGRFFKGPKIYFEVAKDANPSETLEGIFKYTLSRIFPGADPEESVLKDLAEISSNYIDAQRLKTQNILLTNIAGAGTPSEAAERVSETLDQVDTYIEALVETETQTAKAYADREGLTRVAASSGIDDPVVFKYGVIDEKLCSSCRQLWHMTDNIRIPKLYRLSELQEGYNKDKKNPTPTVGPSHPYCRHHLTILMPNFGFDSSGDIIYVGLGFDAYEDQKKRR